MKKSVIVKCISVLIGLSCGESSAKFSLKDFVFGSPAVEQDLEVDQRGSIKNQADHAHEEPVGRVIDDSPILQPHTDTIPLEQVEDHIIADRIEDLHSPDIAQTSLLLEKPSAEIVISESVHITTIDELLTMILNNISMLSKGRHLPRNANILKQQTNEIKSLQLAFARKDLPISVKIEILEQILVAYNNICEIPAAFLDDIEEDMAEKVLNTMFSTYAEESQNLLMHIFNTDVSSSIKQTVNKIKNNSDAESVKNFILWMKSQLQKIPLDLQNAQQKKIIVDLMSSFDQTMVGDFKAKCFKLKMLVDLYNSIKSVPCRLVKISSGDIRSLIGKTIEQHVFDRILESLHLMSESNFTEKSDSDEEAMTARNIKKTKGMILGAKLPTGEVEAGSFSKFRAAQNPQEIAAVLNQAINQFNYTVDWYNKAITKTKKGHSVRISPIADEVDKIVEKLQRYETPNERKESIPEQNDITTHVVAAPELVQPAEVHEAELDAVPGQHEGEKTQAKPENDEQKEIEITVDAPQKPRAAEVKFVEPQELPAVAEH